MWMYWHIRRETVEHIILKKRKEEDEVIELGAGDEIRTHDSLLGKHKRRFSKLERA
jgi:hypothetical protein